jgi:ribosome-binding factor A
MRSTRMRRTDDLVRQVISEALITKVQDPRIGLVSVTGVRVSPEFDTARVYFSVLGDEAVRAETMKGLRSAASFLQSELARSVRMRRVPRLRFIYDDSVDRGFRIDATLRNLGPGEGADGGSPPAESGEGDTEEGGGRDAAADR